MKTVLRASVIAGVFTAIALSGAVAAPASVDPEATVVDTLVVSARAPGPAWWRIKGPTSTVYVLGVPGALPKGMAWDQSVVARRLKGASEVILPPTLSASAGDTVAVLGILGQLHTNTPMEDSLPPALKARFEADRGRMNGDGRGYSHWIPAVAGLQIVADYRHKAGLDAAEPAKTVRRLASAAGVRTQPAATYKAIPLFKAVATQAGAVGPPCLSDALDELEAGPGPARAAADSWARGDVRGALAEQRGYEKCANSFPDGANLTRQAMRDTTSAIAEALAKPGHAIAVVNLRALLAPGGVLEQLRAHGFKVDRPDVGED